MAAPRARAAWSAHAARRRAGAVGTAPTLRLALTLVVVALATGCAARRQDVPDAVTPTLATRASTVDDAPLTAGTGREPVAVPRVGSDTPVAEDAVLTVYAAASLAEAFRAIGRAFGTRHPATRVAFSFAGSQQLATQLLEGAPADVFASANDVQMARVVAAGAVDAGAVSVFATNRLVIAYPAANPAGIAAPADLARPGLKLVVAAPDVPAGGYARAFLAKASASPAFSPAFGAAVLANVVSNEADVPSVLAKVALGEADAGIVYASDVRARLGQRVGWLAIPEALDVVAEYPMAPLAGARHPAAAAFTAFVLGPEGQAILTAHGFGAAP